MGLFRRSVMEFCSICEHNSIDKSGYSRLVDELISRNNAYGLVLAGESWPDEIYDEKILNKLIEIGYNSVIMMALERWPLHRRNKKLVDFMIENGSWRELYALVEYESHRLKNEEHRTMAMDKILELYESGRFHLETSSTKSYFDCILWAGSNWCNNRFSARIANIVFHSQEPDVAKKIYDMGVFWSDDLFVPEIGYCLYKTRDEKFIRYAKEEWKEDRVQCIKKIPIVVSY